VTAILTANNNFSAHTRLVAVVENGQINESRGSVADLYLEIRPGTGKVFIDTFPASKLDTQMSTRFAKNMACKYIEEDCSNYDFFYTIRASAPIIGGPSASASATVATIAAIENLKMKDDVAITGTINSGYIIGPVGGIKEKITAAGANNISKVLIPMGKAVFIDDDNVTINLTSYGKGLGVEVIEIDNVAQALYHATGKEIQKKDDVTVNPEYSETMGFLAGKLCDRSDLLYEKINEKSKDMVLDKNITKAIEIGDNATLKSYDATDKQQHYATASYCFNANVEYSKALYSLQNPNKKEIFDKLASIKLNIAKLNSMINEYDIQTITDLQTFMIVKERLIETEDEIKLIEDNHAEWSYEKILDRLAYANERYHSAIAWSRFFNNNGKKFKLDKEDLKESCINKLSETTEYFQYLNLMIPGLMK